MNPELQRQNDAAKERRARIDRGRPVCRAIAAPMVRERPHLPRGQARQRAAPPEAVTAIEHEHTVRMRCIVEAYEAEKTRRRSVFVAEMAEVARRELADLRACEGYRRDLLAEVRAIEEGNVQ